MAWSRLCVGLGLVWGWPRVLLRACLGLVEGWGWFKVGLGLVVAKGLAKV